MVDDFYTNMYDGGGHEGRHEGGYEINLPWWKWLIIGVIGLLLVVLVILALTGNLRGPNFTLDGTLAFNVAESANFSSPVVYDDRAECENACIVDSTNCMGTYEISDHIAGTTECRLLSNDGYANGVSPPTHRRWRRQVSL